MAEENTERSERHAGWLELFYDLLFVVLVAQLAHSVVADPGWPACGCWCFSCRPGGCGSAPPSTPT